MPFGVVAGLLAGVMIAALVFPNGSDGDDATLSAGGGTAPGVVVGQPGVGTPGPGATIAGGTNAGSGTVPGNAPGGTVSSGSGQPTTGAAAPGTGGGTGGDSPAAPGDPSRPSTPSGGQQAPPPPPPAGEHVDGVQGVTAEKVRIGVVLLDDTSFSNLGDRYRLGDVEGYYDSILAAWKRDGVVPVHGRDVEFVYRKVDPIIGASEQRAACVGFVQDDKVFGVVSTSNLGVGVPCIAQEFRTPLIAGDWQTDEVYQQTDPFLFGVSTSWSRIYRNMPTWGIEKGIYTPESRIGLYYANEPTHSTQVKNYLLPAFEAAGLRDQIVVELTSDSQQASAQDSLAVQQFRNNDVDVALIVGISFAGFQQQAQAQGYLPTYVQNEVNFGSDDTANSTYPPEQHAGTLVATGWRHGERGSGLARSDLQMKCKNDYKELTGNEVGRDDYQTADEAYLWQGCDVTRLMMYGIQQAGRALTQQSWVAGLETMQGQPMAYWGNVTYAQGKHSGVDEYRILEFHGDCRCYKIVDDFQPIKVP